MVIVAKDKLSFEISFFRQWNQLFDAGVRQIPFE